MDLILIELLLWAGLLFLFLGLMDGLGQIESDIEARQLLAGQVPIPSTPTPFDTPEKLQEQIGNYMGSEIYHYATIGGENYQFDHICVGEEKMHLSSGERCLAPGLVYIRYSAA